MHFTVTVPLFGESPKKTYNTYVHYSVPLTEKQADLYMKTQKYQDYLGQKICHYLFYRGLDGNFHPIKSSITGKFLTPKQAMNIKNRAKEKIPLIDKTILMTKGINGLEPVKGFRVEIDIDYKLRYRFLCLLCFWNPCTWICIRELRKAYQKSKHQNIHLIRTKEVHTNINLKV